MEDEQLEDIDNKIMGKTAYAFRTQGYDAIRQSRDEQIVDFANTSFKS